MKFFIVLFLTLFAATSFAAAPLSSYKGTWVNQDSSTSGLTRMIVNTTGSTPTVRIYGKCQPQDCDWGTVDAVAYGYSVSSNIISKTLALSALFEKGFKDSFVTVKPFGSKMIVEVFSEFAPSDSRTDYYKRYIFVKRRILRKRPDLIVSEIINPEWDSSRSRSVIKVKIKNIGTARAGASRAKLADDQTVYASVPALNPGQVHTATFYLPYWVFNPDAFFTVTADHGNIVKELRENNNTKDFGVIG